MTMNITSPEVSFPYGFPKAGLYRIFVQIKRSGRVQTGVFDAHVEEQISGRNRAVPLSAIRVFSWILARSLKDREEVSRKE
jgi:hypothetical protein